MKGGESGGSDPLQGARFSFKVNFDDNLLDLTRNSKSTVRSAPQTLHQSFPPWTAMLLPPTSSPWLRGNWNRVVERH